MSAVIRIAIVLSALLVGGASEAMAVLIYQSETGGALTLFNTDTGTTTPIGNSGVGSIDGLTFAPDGKLYGIRDTISANNASLYTIDVLTGQATLVGQTGLSLPEGLTFGLDATLYTMAGDGLYSLNPATGQSTLLAAGMTQLDGLTVAPFDVATAGGTIYQGDLVGVRPTLDNGGTTYIYSIDPDTLTQVLRHAVPLSVIDETVVFGPDGTLYGNDHIRSPGGSGWWTVDLNGSDHQRIGITSERVWGSAIAPVPEVSTAALCGVGLFVLGVRRRIRHGAGRGDAHSI